MNADGIYLATYAALLLNLKLIRINYYHEDSRQVPISEVSVILEISVFLYFHSAFLLNIVGFYRNSLWKKCTDPESWFIYQPLGYLNSISKCWLVISLRSVVTILITRRIML